MSNEKQETVKDIVKEMRNLGRLDEKSTDKIPRSLQALGLRTYADRIEAAHQREVGELRGERNGILNANASLAADNDRLRREVAELLSENARLRAALKPVLECKVLSAMTAEVKPGRSEYCATIIEKVQHIYNDGEAKQKKGDEK